MLFVQDLTLIITSSQDPLSIFAYSSPCVFSPGSQCLDLCWRTASDFLKLFFRWGRWARSYWEFTSHRGQSLAKADVHSGVKFSSFSACSSEQFQSLTHPVPKTLPWNLTNVPVVGLWCLCLASFLSRTPLPTQPDDCSWEQLLMNHIYTSRWLNVSFLRNPM